MHITLHHQTCADLCDRMSQFNIKLGSRAHLKEKGSTQIRRHRAFQNWRVPLTKLYKWWDA